MVPKTKKSELNSGIEKLIGGLELKEKNEAKDLYIRLNKSRTVMRKYLVLLFSISMLNISAIINGQQNLSKGYILARVLDESAQTMDFEISRIENGKEVDTFTNFRGFWSMKANNQVQIQAPVGIQEFVIKRGDWQQKFSLNILKDSQICIGFRKLIISSTIYDYGNHFKSTDNEYEFLLSIGK